MSIKKAILTLTNIYLFLIGLIVFSLISCNSGVINGDEVNLDTTVSPSLYTFKSNSQKVTGTVEFYGVDSTTGNRYKQGVRDLVNGIKVHTAFNYSPNGQMIESFPIVDGKINGIAKYFYDNGDLMGEVEFKDDKQNGIAKIYNENGIQESEIEYKNGKVIHKYGFDEQGNKIIPITDKIELEKYETGYYEYVDYNSNDILYQPMIKMKFKNISNEPITEKVVIRGTFISDGEEWSTATDYFQGFSDAPLEANISRQSTLQSSTGWKSFLGISKSDVYCSIYINDQFYKKIKIEGVLLTSNRIN